jgi:molecular chaperone DnaK
MKGETIMAARCGIDLGTTYSSVAWYDEYNRRVEVIELVNVADGEKVVRSVVYYPGEGKDPVVGETAWTAARHSEERVIVAIKRAMGSAFKTQPIDGVEYTPQQVSAEILKALASDAQRFLGEEVRDVVITVPAYFGDNERAATEEAGQLAGLNVLGLLPEPHAAALAFSVQEVATIIDRHLLVYDLGGGTFDVTLIHATTATDAANAINLNIETLCKDGDAQLGGLDWDRVLADLVIEKVKQEHDVDLTQDLSLDPILLDNCEKAKRHLGRTDVVSIVPDVPQHEVKISVDEFEARSQSLLFRTQALLEQVLADMEQDPGIGKDQVEVMLTGGASKMPMVRKMVEAVMGKPPLEYRNPELLVSIGAAYWAHLIEGDGTVVVPVKQPDGTMSDQDVSVKGLTDIALYAVGVEVLRPDAQGKETKFNRVVVPAGAAYGQQFEREFQTSADGMTEIPVVLYKGDSPDVSECEHLMRFTIVGLPPDRPKGQLVKVTLGYDGSGIIRGEAVDVSTGQKVDIVVDRSK